MDLPDAGALVAGTVAVREGVAFLAKRFVSKADSVEQKREEERDERERSMVEKLERLLAEVAELKTEVRADRERAAAVQAAVNEVKARIDGVSANHGPRIGALEQELAALKARVGDPLRRSRGRR